MTMNISYYTIDDLKLPAKRPLRKGWTMERFPTLEAALERYRVLPASGIKALGLTDGTHVLELVSRQRHRRLRGYPPPPLRRYRLRHHPHPLPGRTA